MPDLGALNVVLYKQKEKNRNRRPWGPANENEPAELTQVPNFISQQPWWGKGFREADTPHGTLGLAKSFTDIITWGCINRTQTQSSGRGSWFPSLKKRVIVSELTGIGVFMVSSCGSYTKLHPQVCLHPSSIILAQCWSVLKHMFTLSFQRNLMQTISSNSPWVSIQFQNSIFLCPFG